jgi:hypothetical protein
LQLLLLSFTFAYYLQGDSVELSLPVLPLPVLPLPVLPLPVLPLPTLLL